MHLLLRFFGDHFHNFVSSIIELVLLGLKCVVSVVLHFLYCSVTVLGFSGGHEVSNNVGTNPMWHALQLPFCFVILRLERHVSAR